MLRRLFMVFYLRTSGKGFRAIAWLLLRLRLWCFQNVEVDDLSRGENLVDLEIGIPNRVR